MPKGTEIIHLDMFPTVEHGVMAVDIRSRVSSSVEDHEWLHLAINYTVRIIHMVGRKRVKTQSQEMGIELIRLICEQDHYRSSWGGIDNTEGNSGFEYDSTTGGKPRYTAKLKERMSGSRFVEIKLPLFGSDEDLVDTLCLVVYYCASKVNEEHKLAMRMALVRMVHIYKKVANPSSYKAMVKIPTICYDFGISSIANRAA